MITGTDFLCNELKASRDSELEFFLPQLCNLLLHTTSLPLERYAAPRPHRYTTRNDLQLTRALSFLGRRTRCRFMLDFCRRSVHVALRVYFFMKRCACRRHHTWAV
jgi:hypothetical protein